jgi:type VI protein secretion system component Hcp
VHNPLVVDGSAVPDLDPREVRTMEIAVRHGTRLALLAAIGLALILGLTFARPAGGVVPAASVVGRVTYTDISGTTDITTTLRSFSTKTEMIVVGGGGGGGGEGKAAFGAPRAVQDVISSSPLITQALVAGRHMPNVTVTLYHPKTTKRAQVWAFYDALLTLDEQTQRGPSSAAPTETVSWSYEKVRQTTYAADGTTVVATMCFDLKMNIPC